jgi:hydroxymethylpyrimidine pyrophosphatase-like HAD family hydrolase
MQPRGMVVTDLDGTLFQSDRRISARNLRTLEELGRLQVVRVVATGRNLYSARKLLDAAFPLDYLIFSSGAGIMDWRSQRLLWKNSLDRRELQAAFLALSRRGLDFMVHLPIPENHHFLYYASGRPNVDFAARCALYGEFARPGAPTRPGAPAALSLSEACQLLAVEPEPGPAGASAYPELVRELPGLRVIRTTSPLDGRSCWIEVFSREVSKALAAAWVGREAGVDDKHVMAVGNDFNDLDLLAWAPRSFAVRGSPEELRNRFPVVDSGPAGESDFAEAVARWRARM